jgi:hypothetical protein
MEPATKSLAARSGALRVISMDSFPIYAAAPARRASSAAIRSSV